MLTQGIADNYIYLKNSQIFVDKIVMILFSLDLTSHRHSEEPFN